MTAPKHVEIRSRWTAKRGRKVLDLSIKQIHRADRAVTVIDAEGARRIVPWRELKRYWKPVGR